METIIDMMGSGTIVLLVISLLAGMFPENKLHSFGKRCGLSVSRFGNLKWGSVYEQVERFLQNSLGCFFGGFKEGLDYDEIDRDE